MQVTIDAPTRLIALLSGLNVDNVGIVTNFYSFALSERLYLFEQGAVCEDKFKGIVLSGMAKLVSAAITPGNG